MRLNLRRFVLSALLSIIMACCFSGVSYAETFALKYGSCIATVTNIECSGDLMLVSFDFKNNGSSGTSFAWNVTMDAYQNNVSCNQRYFHSKIRNTGVEVKNGASVDVITVFDLNNNEDIVEIEIGSWGFMLNSFYVYFNPATGKWGSKADVMNVAIYTPSPSPSPTASSSSSPSSAQLNSGLSNTEENGGAIRKASGSLKNIKAKSYYLVDITEINVLDYFDLDVQGVSFEGDAVTFEYKIAPKDNVDMSADDENISDAIILIDTTCYLDEKNTKKDTYFRESLKVTKEKNWASDGTFTIQLSSDLFDEIFWDYSIAHCEGKIPVIKDSKPVDVFDEQGRKVVSITRENFQDYFTFEVTSTKYFNNGKMYLKAYLKPLTDVGLIFKEGTDIDVTIHIVCKKHSSSGSVLADEEITVHANKSEKWNKSKTLILDVKNEKDVYWDYEIISVSGEVLVNP